MYIFRIDVLVGDNVRVSTRPRLWRELRGDRDPLTCLIGHQPRVVGEHVHMYETCYHREVGYAREREEGRKGERKGEREGDRLKGERLCTIMTTSSCWYFTCVARYVTVALTNTALARKLDT